MEWNGMEWHGLRHIKIKTSWSNCSPLASNTIWYLYCPSFKALLEILNKWYRFEPLTEWTFKNLQEVILDDVFSTSARSKWHQLHHWRGQETCQIWGVGWQPMLRKHTPRFAPTAYLQQQMLPWPYDFQTSRTTKWHLINPNSKMLPEHTPMLPLCDYALGAYPWHSSN